MNILYLWSLCFGSYVIVIVFKFFVFLFFILDFILVGCRWWDELHSTARKEKRKE